MTLQIRPIASTPAEAPSSTEYQQDRALFMNVLQRMGNQLSAMQEENSAVKRQVDLIAQDRNLLIQQTAIQGQQIDELNARVTTLGDENKRLRLQASITDLKLKRQVLEGDYSYYEATLPYVLMIPAAGYAAIAAALFTAKTMNAHNIENKRKIDAVTAEIQAKQRELKALEAPPTEKN